MPQHPIVVPPLLRGKAYQDPSEFVPESLLREARRQKNIPVGTIPSVCILDPDGDIVRQLVTSGLATGHPCWACYHTDLYEFNYEVRSHA